MKINRIKLVALLGKQDCKEFDNHIIELLKEQYSEEEIDISSKLHLITKCNTKQLELLKSIGIEPKREWSRDSLIRTNSYYFVNRNADNGFCIGCNNNNLSANPNFIFDNKEEADYTALYFRTYLLMKSWIKHHYPDWNPEWTIKERKYGIANVKNNLIVDYNWYANDFLFGLTVPTEEAANLLFEEFKEDLTTLFIK